MKILAIDSSGQTASVAVWEDDLILAEFYIHAKKTHSQTLLPMLEAVREKTELDMTEIDAVAVTSGPGSFTGLRIGSATAKGFGFALKKPIIPVPTLEGLAYNMYGTDRIICPLMDARRNQTYTGLYEFVKRAGAGVADGTFGGDLSDPSVGERGRHCEDYDMHIIKEQCAVPVEEILTACNELGRSVIFLGDGVPVFRGQIKNKVTVPYSFAPAHMNRQRAAAVAALAAKYYKEGRIQTAAEHAPEYLRLSQAEREQNRRRAAEQKREQTGHTPAEINIRRMTGEDVPAAAALERECFSQPWSENAYRSALANENAVYLAAETEDGSFAGMCGVLDILGEGDISNVAVRESFRRQGIAERMLRELMREGKKRGIAAFTLEVRASNEAAVRLYEKLGFACEGCRKNFYENPREDALILWMREDI